MSIAVLMLALAQESALESELTTAIQATISKGFAYTLRPVATMPDGMPRERLALAGAPISGEYSDGVYHAKDGTYEIFRKGAKTAVRTERGWLSLAQYSSPLRQDVAQAFDDQDGRLWKRGNVTAGRKALAQLIQINHLDHRTHIERLSKVSGGFVELRPAEPIKIDGKAATVLEGPLSDTAAFNLLQGPFAALVERGTLSFQNLSGTGRVAIQGGVIRRIALKAAGSYAYYEETDNVRRKGSCSLELVGDLTKHGDVKVEPPKDAAQLLKD